MSETLLKLKAEMERISPDITPRDRKLAIEKLGYMQSTISHYINGNDKAVNADVYYDLIKFFRECISKRMSILEPQHA